MTTRVFIGIVDSMKKLFTIFTILSTFLVFAAPTFAQETRDGGTITIQKDEIVKSDFFAGGESVNIYGTVEGDAFVGSGTVDVDGVVEGDLIAAGGTIKVDGEVKGNIRVAGGTVTLNGKVGKNVTVFGGTLTLTENSIVGGSVVGAGGDVILNGEIGRDVLFGGGSISLEGKIGGNVTAATESLKLTPDTMIEKDLVYYGASDATIADGAEVKGTIERKDTPKQIYTAEKDMQSARDALRAVGSGARFFGLLSFLLVALIISKFFPKFAENVAKKIDSKPWASAGWGFLLLVAVPVLVVFLFITIIGIPLAMILVSLYFVALYVAKYFSIVWLGNWINEKAGWENSLYLRVIIGLAVYGLLTFIPVFGFFVSAFAGLAGIGAGFMLVTKRE